MHGLPERIVVSGGLRLLGFCRSEPLKNWDWSQRHKEEGVAPRGKYECGNKGRRAESEEELKIR